MKKAEDLLNEGRLTEAVEELNQAVRSQPTDTRFRTFLFELLCFQGLYERAGKQLDVIAAQSDKIQAGLVVEAYRSLVKAEKTRQQVFQDEALPKFFLTPPNYVEEYVVLTKKIRETPAEIGRLLGQAEQMFPPLGGRVGDRSFSSFRDGDDRVAPVLEVFHSSDYLWLPFEQIKILEVSEPKTLSDLIWTPARVETHEQPIGDVLIPALYVFSCEHDSDQVKLGRVAEFQTVADQLVYGMGQRLFLVDGEEIPLLELRTVEFNGTQRATSS